MGCTFRLTGNAHLVHILGMTTLAEWMEKKALKDRDLASRVEGLSRSQISRIRRRKSRPTPETAQKLEAVTGIPAAQLVMVERA